MADLRDQLLKAGLITPEQAKQAGHQKRQQNKKLGHEGKAKEAESRRAEVKQEQSQRTAQDRERSQHEQSERQEAESTLTEKQRKRAAIERALREGASPRWEGNRSYYFRDGSDIVYLMVNEEAQRLLEAGKAAIVRGDGRARYVLIQAGFVKDLRKAAPERVVTFHRE